MNFRGAPGRLRHSALADAPLRYGNRPSELEAKFLLLCLFGLGALATWADSEAVLPAYVIGMVLAGTVGKDHALIRRLRTLTFGLLTPFYFIRAGSLVSVPALIAAPAAFLYLLLAKMATKVIGVYPVTRWYKSPRKEAAYTTLLMSTGLTFGTISALFGLSHQVIDQAQYSALVAAVIGSAVVPTLIANAFFLPRHLLPKPDGQAVTVEPKPEAFGYGLDLAEKYGAGLYVLSVARPPDFAEEVETEAVLNHSRDHYRKAMEPLRKRAEASAAKVHFEVAVGHPAEQIIYHAEHYGADLIIVGHRGKTFFQRWLLGSIAKQTLDHAPCAVLVTR